MPAPVQSSGNGLWVRYVVSGEIKTKVGMTYHDGPKALAQLEKGIVVFLFVRRFLNCSLRRVVISHHVAMS